MSGTSPVALIVTSNDFDNRLYQIETERKGIEDALSHYHDAHQLLVKSTQFTSIDELFNLLNEYSGRLVLLHFAGHFGSGLQFNDSQLGTETANNKGIAGVLGKEAREGILKFVFLNGCSTKSLLEALRAENIPSIIGTNYPIPDNTATELAIAFYRKLANAEDATAFRKAPTTLIAAFEFALQKLETKNKIFNKTETKRGFCFNVKEIKTTELWELDTIEPAWVLPNRAYKPTNKNGDLAAISCDRKQLLARFEMSLAKKKHLYAQFYFLAEQPFGEVESLLKRLVHHLMEDFPKTKPVNHEDIEPVDIDTTSRTNEDEVQFALVKGFNKDFEKSSQVQYLKELTEAIPTQHPSLQGYTHFPFLFKINTTEECWQNHLQKGLKWFMQDFAQLDKSDYRFVFFFVINLESKKETVKKGGFFESLFKKKNTTPNEVTDIYTLLENFTQPFEQATTLPPLTKVDRSDLDEWYKRYEKNAADRADLVEVLVQKIRTRTGHDEPWDMSYVESELKKIVEEKSNAVYGI
jgi:hypothetical protein